MSPRWPCSGWPTTGGASGSAPPSWPAAAPMPTERAWPACAAHAVGHLAGYKRPKQYEVVDELPRTATGKVQRRLSRAARPD